MSTNLQALRIAKGISKTDLAQQVAVSVSYISKLESGVFPLTSTLVRRLCPILNCSSDDFIDDASDHYSFGEKDVTFKSNLMLSIHKWYPYIEGFSENFVKGILEKHSTDSVIYDPFNGSGTTMLTGAYSGYRVLASEINPFMRFVANTKVNTVRAIISSDSKLAYLKNVRDEFCKLNDTNYPKVRITDFINPCFIDDGFFVATAIEKIASLKSKILEVIDNDISDILKLCLASILVETSTMIRAADLRKRTVSEQHDNSKYVVKLFNEKLVVMVADIIAVKDAHIADALIISNNAKDTIPECFGKTDIIITSPPYVNGTNYFRNTKIELWILDFIHSKDELRSYRSQAITAGINNVSKDIAAPRKLPYVEKYATILDEVSPDKRIPAMIRAYFSDMSIVFSNWSQLLKNGGKLYFDIGDSEYYGVHIPVDEIVERIAEERGLILSESLITRNRKSKKGTVLNQKLLVFEKCNSRDIAENITEFGKTLPYKHGEFAKRNWGNNMHSLCSYQGKLKPAIAYHLIEQFTKEGDVILDPFCGIGTIPLEACLRGRIGTGIDLNPIAYANTLAKVKKLSKEKINSEIERLTTFIKENPATNDDIIASDIKLPISNGRISEYYHAETLREILSARKFFATIDIHNAEQQFLLACMLHILHGNRPYALSKRSNNQTPLKPRQDEVAIYKNVAEKVRGKAERMFSALDYDENFCEGSVQYGSVFDVEIISNSIDAIITSPPFASSTRFYSSNWLRLWFCGSGSDNMTSEKEKFVDYQQERDFDNVYNRILNVYYDALKSQGLAIMHLGKTKKIDMLKRISTLIETDSRFEILGTAEESVTECNKHGIRDQGATTDHQFLFFCKV
jgi:DNA modification methylase